MECRPKRTIGLTRQISNSGTETAAARKRSSFHKRASSAHKQASTQTEPYEDLFLSDESASSNEDNCTNVNTLINSKTIIDDNTTQTTSFGSFETSSIPNKISESFDPNNNNNNNNTSSTSTINTQRNNRHRRYKKFSKRRKSLPSQGSSNEEPHPVTLIPRGPLICSNNENNWLPDRFSLLNYSSSIINNSISCDYDTSSNISINNNNNNNNNKISNISNNNNNNTLVTSDNSNSNLSITPSTSTFPDSILKPSSLSFDISSSSPKTKIITKQKNKNSITFRSPIPSTVNYDVNIIKTTVYNTSSNTHTVSKTVELGASSSNIASKKYCSRIESDFYLNDFIDDDEVIDTGTYSSNDDDSNDIMFKLKEAEKVCYFWRDLSLTGIGGELI
jgi:hypothetical protein